MTAALDLVLGVGCLGVAGLMIVASYCRRPRPTHALVASYMRTLSRDQSL
jgi:hypothetical protein